MLIGFHFYLGFEFPLYFIDIHLCIKPQNFTRYVNVNIEFVLSILENRLYLIMRMGERCIDVLLIHVNVYGSFVGPFSEPAYAAQFLFREPGLGYFIIKGKCTIHIDAFSFLSFSFQTVSFQEMEGRMVVDDFSR